VSGVASSREGAVAICRLQDPERRNALTAELLTELVEALERAAAEPAVRALVIAGADDVFASGWDVVALADERAGFDRAPGPELWRRLERLEPPLLAAVSGWALGGGFELALRCDLVVADERSHFGLPEITLGMLPGGGVAALLAQAVGRRRALELVLTGARIEAARAREIGLVNLTTSRGRCLPTAVGLAAELASRSPAALRAAKRLVLEGLERPESALEREHELAAGIFAGAERAEAMRALRRGRSPRFAPD
jgi:enoyl-CoA hydratase